MSKGWGARLSKAGKSGLLDAIRGSISGHGRATPEHAPANAADFGAHPVYRQMETQAKAAAAMGVSNPFFRVHDGRAGPTTRIAGVEQINFASYDYLGLNGHPDVAAAAKAAIDTYGVSVSASRLVAGERGFHVDLEQAIADFVGVEAALTFVSGHATNVGVIGQLLGPKDLVIYDSLSHNSVVVGAQLSGAARRSFPHNDLDALQALLESTRRGCENCLIVVEGLYSMDGDFPDLARLIELKSRYNAWLMVDEAHALGVLGKTGRGIAEHAGIDPRQVDIWMGTLSKTLAACGGYIAASAPLIQILKFHCPGFVYSVGMPAPVAAAALAALRVLEREPERVARLSANGHHMLALARAAGLDTGPSSGYAIIPIMVGDSLRAAKLSERLSDRGINALPIVYPAVPMQSARLRFFVTSEHTHAQIDTAVDATQEELARLQRENFGLGRFAQALLEKS